MGLALALLLPQDGVQVSFYGGKAWQLNSDVEYAGADIDNASWDEDDILLGARIAYWRSEWALAIDVQRTELALDEDGFDGLLELSPYYIVNLTLMTRCRAGPIKPYGGIGIGVVVTDVRAEIGGDDESDYEIEAPAAQVLVGVELDVAGPVSIFVEGKLAYADLDLQIPGGTVEALLFTPQLAAGLSITF